jgi:hypothetical protein
MEFDFPSGFLRLTNASHNFTWNGYTWYGAASVGSVAPVEETHTLEAKGCSFRVTGIDPANISRVVGEQYQGRDVRMWLAFLTDDYQMIADPVEIYYGRMDVPTIQLGKEATITLSTESHLVSWESPKVRRYNHSDQLQRYPGDIGMEFVEQMAAKEIVWGRA